MKKNNTLLITAAAAIALYFFLKKKKGNTQLDQKAPDVAIDPNIDLIKSQTVNFPQVVPTPSTIMDVTNNNQYNSYGCGCENKKLGNMPYIC